MTLRLPLSVRAFAKINLTLRVRGVRADGYHELRTVFQSLALHDLLTFDLVPGPFTIACDDPACPVDASNLVWRAAEQVWTAAGRRGAMHGVRITLTKRIPMQAGLGGGSSDAAATLRMLGALWAPALPVSALEAMGAALGADVPFFFRGGTVLGVERGDRLFSLADSESSWVVLAQPDFGVSTADAYRWFDEGQVAVQALSAGAGATDSRGAATGRRPKARAAVDAGPYGDGGNDLEGPVAARFPAIGRLVAGFRRHGAHWAAMSGSGSVCFGLFRSKTAANRAAAALASTTVTTIVTRAQTSAEYAAEVAPFRAAEGPSPLSRSPGGVRAVRPRSRKR